MTGAAVAPVPWTGEWQVEVVDSVEAACVRDDDLATGLYGSPAWVRFTESVPAVETEYVVVSDARGRIAAGLPVSRAAVETNANYTPEALLGTEPGSPYQVAGPRRGYVTDLATRPGLTVAQRRAVVALAWTAARERGHALGCRGTVLPFLDTESARLLTEVDEGIVPLLAGLDSVVSLPGHGLDDYVATLPRKRAAVVRREMAVFDEAAYDVAVEPLSACWSEAGPLLSLLQQRYGHPDTPEQCRGHLLAQARALDARSVVFTARRAGELVGFSLFFAHDDTLYGRLVGFDHAKLRDAFEYFNLYFYLPVAFAYEHGLDALHLGRGSYASKRQRGAVLSPRWTVSSVADDHRGAPSRNAASLAALVSASARAEMHLPAGWLEEAS